MLEGCDLRLKTENLCSLVTRAGSSDELCKKLEGLQVSLGAIQMEMELQTSFLEKDEKFRDVLLSQKKEILKLTVLLQKEDKVESRTPVKSTVGSSKKKRRPSKVDIKNMINLQRVAEEEFIALPKHVRGRLTVEKVNLAIQEIEAFLIAKERLMQSNTAKLTLSQKSIFEQYEADINSETTGYIFFTDRDIRDNCEKLRYDMTGKAIISLLKFTKRIKQTGGAKVIRYIII